MQNNLPTIKQYECRLLDKSHKPVLLNDWMVDPSNTESYLLNQINCNIGSALSDLPAYSSVHFQAGRINRQKDYWFELCDKFSFFYGNKLVTDSLNQSLNIDRFNKYQDSELIVEVGEIKIQWLRNNNDDLLFPAFVGQNGTLSLAHNLEVRQKQKVFQESVDAAVLELALASAIHILGPETDVDLSFFRLISPIHVVLETRMDVATGGLRTRTRVTLDAAIFNDAIVPPHFQLITAEQVMKILPYITGACYYDCRKGFYSTITGPHLFSYTGFKWRNMIGLYLTPVFGLSISPAINQAFMDLALHHFNHSLATTITDPAILNTFNHTYTDDTLLTVTSKVNNKKPKVHIAAKLFLSIYVKLGITTNALKSYPLVKTSFDHLGFNMNSLKNNSFATVLPKTIVNLDFKILTILSMGINKVFELLQNEYKSNSLNSFHPELSWSKEHRLKFHETPLTIKNVEQVVGSILWINVFYTSDVFSFALTRIARYPYLQRNKLLERTAKNELKVLSFMTKTFSQRRQLVKFTPCSITLDLNQEYSHESMTISKEQITTFVENVFVLNTGLSLVSTANVLELSRLLVNWASSHKKIELTIYCKRWAVSLVKWNKEDLAWLVILKKFKYAVQICLDKPLSLIFKEERTKQLPLKPITLFPMKCRWELMLLDYSFRSHHPIWAPARSTGQVLIHLETFTPICYEDSGNTELLFRPTDWSSVTDSNTWPVFNFIHDGYLDYNAALITKFEPEFFMWFFLLEKDVKKVKPKLSFRYFLQYERQPLQSFKKLNNGKFEQVQKPASESMSQVTTFVHTLLGERKNR